jgi:hypothetical protein
MYIYIYESTRGLTRIFLIRLASCCSEAARVVKQSKQATRRVYHTHFAREDRVGRSECGVCVCEPQKGTYTQASQQENPPHVKQFRVLPLILCLSLYTSYRPQKSRELLRCIAMLHPCPAISLPFVL